MAACLVYGMWWGWEKGGGELEEGGAEKSLGPLEVWWLVEATQDGVPAQLCCAACQAASLWLPELGHR